MYLWKTKRIAAELKENRVSENKKMRYFLTISIISIAGVYLNALNPPSSYIIFFGELILALIITFFGIKITFTTNGGNDGSNYISMVVCLSLPILIKVFIISFFYGIIVGVIAQLFSTNLQNISWVFSILSILVLIFYFWRLNYHLNLINS